MTREKGKKISNEEILSNDYVIMYNFIKRISSIRDVKLYFRDDYDRFNRSLFPFGITDDMIYIFNKHGFVVFKKGNFRIHNNKESEYYYVNIDGFSYPLFSFDLKKILENNFYSKEIKVYEK